MNTTKTTPTMNLTEILDGLQNKRFAKGEVMTVPGLIEVEIISANPYQFNLTKLHSGEVQTWEAPAS